LVALAHSLYALRLNRPIVTKSGKTQEGAVLGFVTGLRLSAKLIYFLRERLSGLQCEVNWGHLLTPDRASCSPECDVIIHKPGHLEKWNGGHSPVMDFRFIESAKAVAVISCKSNLTQIDKKYPGRLAKHGVRKVYLFAECCRQKDYPRLKQSALANGYSSLGCLYLLDAKGEILINDAIHNEFITTIRFDMTAAL
jgi:hypothetical protein